MNANGGTYVGVAWAAVQGYSKFGQFVGNGSTNGPFVYTGFKPKYMWYRNVSRNNNSAFYEVQMYLHYQELIKLMKLIQ